MFGIDFARLRRQLRSIQAKWLDARIEGRFYQRRKTRRGKDPVTITFRSPFPTSPDLISFDRTEEQTLRSCSRR